MSVPEHEVITQQVIVKREIEWRDKVIECHENGLKELNRKVDALTEALSQICTVVKGKGHVNTEELIATENDFVVDDEDHPRTFVELHGRQQPVQNEGDNQIFAELVNITKTLKEELPNVETLVKQQADVETLSKEAEHKDLADVEVVIGPAFDVKETGMNGLAEAKKISSSSALREIAAVIEALSNCLAQAHQTVVKKDQIIESKETELRVLNENLALIKEDVVHLREQLVEREIEINDKKRLIKQMNVELDFLRSRVRTSSVELSNLKVLLEQAELKLNERQEKITQLQQIGNKVLEGQTLAQRVDDEKLNETSSKIEIMQKVTKSVEEVMSSWAVKIMQRVDNASTRKISAESSTPNQDPPLPVQLNRLQQLYRLLVEKLSAKPVAAILFQSDVLTLTELQDVQCSPTSIKAAESLLNQLLHKRCEISTNRFMNALKETNQEYLFLWLTYDDYNIDFKHTDLIRRNFTFLVNEVSPRDSRLIEVLFEEKVIEVGEKEYLEAGEDYNIDCEHTDLIRRNFTLLLNEVSPQDTGLIGFLFQEKVIEMEEKQYLEAGEGAVRQMERLLSVLSRKPIELFDRFLVALDQTGNSQVANILRKKPPSEPGTLVIAATRKRKGEVMGLTVLGDELFIVRSMWHKGRIEVYNVTDCTFKRKIKVSDLKGSDVYGLASCDTNNCLYVSHRNFGENILRVEVTGDNTVVKWEVKDSYLPQGLSVNREHNLLVACSWSNKLIEYTTRGECVREISLQLPDGVNYPHHAIQLDMNRYLVSHGDDESLHRVCLVDANGRVLHKYGNERGSETGQLNAPQQLAVDANGLIFVADQNNDRIAVLVLDSTLQWSRDLQFGGGGVKFPCSLYLDSQRNVLFVGERNGDNSRVIANPLIYEKLQ